jgi:exopolysaccharide biosynthesis polyprenyl glycosylphosphotransferase
MTFNRRTPLVLLAGDAAIFVVSLWLTLFMRYFEKPTEAVFLSHLAPFSFLFVVWILVFFIFGLYEKQGMVFRSELPGTLFRCQLSNALIATAFFYFIPWYGISPKTTLFLYLFVSLCLILLWRMYGYFAIAPKSREKALVIGSGEEMRELVLEIKRSSHYNLDLVYVIDLDSFSGNNPLRDIQLNEITLVVVDLYNDKVQAVLPHLYNLLFSQIRFISMDRLYEDVFDRVPLSLVKHNWFLENISTAPKLIYGVLKRMMDVILSFILGAVSLIAYPFVAIAIKLDDGGPLFIAQERVGERGELVKIYKFRSMTKNEKDLSLGKDNRITKPGAFLRKSRIDELPQLWNVLKGDLSLIGPRPELPSGVRLYEKEIPYYGIRHLIKPGLSGWAQLYQDNHPHHSLAVEETKEKLSYDLFYIKNRSFFLDLNIALKTIKKLLSREGA